jgi:hypothetical protein
MLDSPRTSRRLAAFGLIAGPLLYLVSFALQPSWSDDTATYLAGVASAQGRHAAWAGFFALGALLLLPGLLGVARLLRGSRGSLARVGATALGVSAVMIGGLVLAIAVTEVAMVAPAADAAEMGALYDRTEKVTFANVVFGVLWFGGFVLGTLALAVGLVLRRVVTLLSPLLLVAWLGTMFFFDGRTGTIVGCVLLVAAFAPLARRIVTLEDEEWARWQPLADPSGERAPAGVRAGVTA